jgi:N-acyl homoserine lactone hydrolase
MSRRPTPTITLTPFTCGRVTLPFSSMVGGGTGEITVPVTAYLIEHAAGLAVFDSGLGPRSARPVGEALEGPVDLEEDALIDARLRAMGVDPAHIDYILNSHLHSPHAGGNALLTAASVIVQTAEWEHARASIESGYHVPEFDTGQPIIQISGEHDVFGDGSVVLVPTPGHTPGHQSARVQTGHGEVVLAGDVGDLRSSLDGHGVPDSASSALLYRESLQWLRARKRAGATIAFSHDPDFWATVAHSVPWDPVPDPGVTRYRPYDTQSPPRTP